MLVIKHLFSSSYILYSKRLKILMFLSWKFVVKWYLFLNVRLFLELQNKVIHLLFTDVGVGCGTVDLSGALHLALRRRLWGMVIRKARAVQNCLIMLPHIRYHREDITITRIDRND